MVGLLRDPGRLAILAVTGDALLENGGRMAFVGPTGVGKTTAIAKIAARWVLRHGSRDIALVSVDGQRRHPKLLRRQYGGRYLRRLGRPVRRAEPGQLPAATVACFGS